MTGEHWDSATGKELDKKKDQYVRIQWKTPQEKDIATIITKERLGRDASLEERLLHWKVVAKEVPAANCILHKDKIGKKDSFVRFEFYNWEEPETETSYDVCIRCIMNDAMKIKLDALKTLGKNPFFTPKIACSSTSICPSFASSKSQNFNCTHIALKFETIIRKLKKGGAKVDLSPLLYCKRAHPAELILPSEKDVDWNVSLAGSAILLSNMTENLKRAKKQIKQNPGLIASARATFATYRKMIENALGVSLDEEKTNSVPC